MAQLENSGAVDGERLEALRQSLLLGGNGGGAQDALAALQGHTHSQHSGASSRTSSASSSAAAALGLLARGGGMPRGDPGSNPPGDQQQWPQS
mmetsp:Transcript_13559/g.16371  ORF Transcript_13559/g.16371 Transcript_13559/m.16371 type:complete len:93 (-) Transcript_13559:238-516(-)